MSYIFTIAPTYANQYIINDIPRYTYEYIINDIPRYTYEYQSKNYKQLKRDVLSSEFKSPEKIQTMKNNFNNLSGYEQRSILKELNVSFVNSVNFFASLLR